ncbi:MAG: hypothetical protein HXY50_11690 [Ignavibacteriaceae bacterium]|nr:hypothetical protein [Ignavibacteriaceae bacterium]
MNKHKENITITYYDFADLNYASYFLVGIYENQTKFNFKFLVKKSIPPFLKEIDPKNDWTDILFSICIFEVTRENESFYFCIDTRDSNTSDINLGKGFHLPLLQSVKYYFKVNYNKSVINKEIDVIKHSQKIIPAWPFFPIKFTQPFLYRPRLIPSKDIHWTYFDLRKRIKFILRNLTLREIIDMRNSKKERDIFFVTNFYEGELHRADNEYRYKLIYELKKKSKLNSISGFIGQNLPAKFKEFELPPFRIGDYLNELAKSKIGIYVRGLLNCISFKFGQYLALGLPIVGQQILNNKENLMQYENFYLQFAYNEPKEIIEKAIELVQKPEMINTIGHSNAELFDKFFHPKKTVEKILIHLFS